MPKSEDGAGLADASARSATAALKARVLAEKQKAQALRQQLLECREQMRDEQLRSRETLKDLRSRTWATNKAMSKIIERISGEVLTFDEITRFQPFPPDLVAKMGKSIALQGDVLASLIQGSDLSTEMVTAIRRLLATNDLYKATSLAHALLRSGEAQEAACTAMALVCRNHQRFDSAYHFFARVSFAFIRRHALVDFVDTAYRCQPEQARAAVELFMQVEEAQDLPAAVRLGLATTAYAYGDREQGFEIAEQLISDIPAMALLTSTQSSDVNWFVAFGRRRRIQTVSTSALAGPRLAIYDYKNADRARTSANVGDYIQTLALLVNIARFEGMSVNGDSELTDLMGRLKERIRPSMRQTGGSGDITLRPINRDCSYDNDVEPGTWLIAYGWHMHGSFRGRFQFPFHENLEPIFISFHIKYPELLTEEAVHYLRRNGPIGCRDWSTVCLLISLGVPAFFSGCLTVTLDAAFEDAALPLAEDGARVIACVDALVAQDEPDIHRRVIDRRPAWIRDVGLIENLHFAISHLDELRQSASVVETSRLHCALPCRAMGVPVFFHSKNPGDPRFEGLIGIDDDAFARLQAALRERIAGLVCRIGSGASPQEVRQWWAEACEADVRSARARAMRPVPLAFFDFSRESVCDQIRSNQIRIDRAEVDRRIDVAFATDANLIEMLPAVLESARQHTSVPLRAWVLTRGLDEARLRGMAAAFTDVEFRFLSCEKIEYGNAVLNRLPVSTLDRLLLPDLLPTVDRLIYLDIDMLVLGDLAELAGLDLSGQAVGAQSTGTRSNMAFNRFQSVALRQSAEKASLLRRLVHQRFNTDQPLFNAGLLILDLERMRVDSFPQWAVSLACEFQMNDQDVLNLYVGSDWQPLPVGWNINPRQELPTTIKLVHWAGRLKPWSDDYVMFKEQWTACDKQWRVRLENYVDFDAALVRAHIMERVAATEPGSDPFRHMYIEGIFPESYYNALLAYMQSRKHTGAVEDRRQDSSTFVTKRFNLVSVNHPLIDILRSVFNDPEVKLALLRKFYVSPSSDFAKDLTIHKEFEFFFTKANRLQNIHVDIPPKCLSFVFYFPERDIPKEFAEHNGTVLYDRDLDPHYPAKYRSNTCCIFAPHFYSYHGFASTIDRDVLVMFLVSDNEMNEWLALKGGKKEQPPFTPMLAAIESKIRRLPLIEYGGSEERLLAERDACLINAPNGRVMRADEADPDVTM
jgi:lipopolysaccharide biosynthesis glycosyltransferase